MHISSKPIREVRANLMFDMQLTVTSSHTNACCTTLTSTYLTGMIFEKFIIKVKTRLEIMDTTNSNSLNVNVFGNVNGNSLNSLTPRDALIIRLEHA